MFVSTVLVLHKFKQIQQAVQFKDSEKYGDFAVLKAEILGAQANPAIADQLEAVTGYHPPIDLEQLSTYPLGTFGRTYADHMRANRLKPFNVSPELEAIAQRNVFALRYVVTHDIFHVLLGFDTSYAGEIGVLAFAAAQQYSSAQRLSLWLAKILYPILAPQQINTIFANVKKGQQLGQRADCLLSYCFEEHWHEPINTVRSQLGLPQLTSGSPNGTNKG